MDDIKIAVESTTTTKHSLRLTGKQILKLLKEANIANLTENAKVIVRVPGGGDWSNTDLSIDHMSPIEITWTTTEHSR